MHQLKHRREQNCFHIHSGFVCKINQNLNSIDVRSKVILRAEKVNVFLTFYISDMTSILYVALVVLFCSCYYLLYLNQLPLGFSMNVQSYTYLCFVIWLCICVTRSLCLTLTTRVSTLV